MTETQEDLGNGLILRRATRADTEALADFNSRVHSDNGWDSPDPGVGAWVRDLMTGPHPSFDVGDFLVVEDTTNGTIASSSNLISQTWSYAGIEFGVGRPELVGTHPDYRRRGLIRKQFEILHRWSAERGELVQAITGIPWYYRQFGYDMAMNLHGARRGPETGLPELKAGETEPYVVRPATAADLGFIADVDAFARRHSLVNCVRSAAQWAYELSGHNHGNAVHFELRVIETGTGEPIGYLAHPPVRWGSNLCAIRYELKPGVSWWAVTPPVLRYLKATGPTLHPYVVDPDGGPPFKG
ncbi:MAG: GNAT family N-acetyltransferase, partial [Anaerolineae bacterium]